MTTIQEALHTLKETKTEKKKTKAEIAGAFIEAVKAKYEGVTFHPPYYEIPLKSFLPSSVHLLSDYSLRLWIDKRSGWTLSVGDGGAHDGIKVKTTAEEVLSRDSVEKVLEAQNKLPSFEQDRLHYNIRKACNLLGFSVSKTPKAVVFSFGVDKKWQVTAYKYEDKTLDGVVKVQLPYFTSYHPLDIELLTSYTDTLKEILVGNCEQFKVVDSFIHNLNLSQINKEIRIKVDQIKDNQIGDLATKPQYISEEEKESFSDYLLENCEKELRLNDVKGAVKKIRETSDHCSGGFLYAYFWEEFDIDLLKALDYDLELLYGDQYRPNQLHFPYSVRNRGIILTKELMDRVKPLYVGLGDVPTVTIEEGVTSIKGLNIRFGWHSPNYESGIIVLPTSLTEQILSETTNGIDSHCYIGFKPVEINGEKVSPFTISNLAYETYKDCFIAL